MWYDRAVRLLVMPPDLYCWRVTPGPRLTRSIRVISRASSQSNLDLRFLLCLVALETLVSFKHEDIAQSVADIGARVMAHDAAERHKVFRDLKEATIYAVALCMLGKYLHSSWKPECSNNSRPWCSPSGVRFHAAFLIWSIAGLRKSSFPRVLMILEESLSSDTVPHGKKRSAMLVTRRGEDNT